MGEIIVELIIFLLACTKHEVSHMCVSYTVKMLRFIFFLDNIIK